MSETHSSTTAAPNLVYCRCTYARVVPRQVKDGVLEALSASGIDFDAVPDLCEMSARRDPRLAEIAGGRAVTIAACYPRAVRWLFSSAGSPLDKERVTILNMREETAETVAASMLAPSGDGPGGTAGEAGTDAADDARSANGHAGDDDGGER
jgi:hypothetical protein